MNPPTDGYEPDYKTPIFRAILINKIENWYNARYRHNKEIKDEYIRVSIFDLIADFVIDSMESERDK